MGFNDKSEFKFTPWPDILMVANFVISLFIYIEFMAFAGTGNRTKLCHFLSNMLLLVLGFFSIRMGQSRESAMHGEKPEATNHGVACAKIKELKVKTAEILKDKSLNFRLSDYGINTWFKTYIFSSPREGPEPIALILRF